MRCTNKGLVGPTARPLMCACLCCFLTISSANGFLPWMPLCEFLDAFSAKGFVPWMPLRAGPLGLIHMFATSCGLKRVLLCAHACHGAIIWSFWPRFSVECTEFPPRQGLIPPCIVEHKGLCWCAQTVLCVALA
ncbi:hypothetical protein V6N13_025819 [Hibiscus sabdariffa]|uniref:Secreted protein n=1 Tax=Hibiscus sabdariffa TaxID=183260 RepID=A0ABR2AG23_9ROSI